MDANDHTRLPGERRTPDIEGDTTPPDALKRLIPDTRIDQRFAELMQSLSATDLTEWVVDATDLPEWVDDALPELFKQAERAERAERAATVNDLQRARKELQSARNEAKEIVDSAAVTARAIKDQALDAAAFDRREAKLDAERDRLAAERDRLAAERDRLTAKEADLAARERRAVDAIVIRKQQVELDLERRRLASLGEVEQSRLEVERMRLEMEHAQVHLNRLRLESEALLKETFERAQGMSPKPPELPPARVHALEGVPQPSTGAHYTALPVPVPADAIGHRATDSVRAILVIMAPGGAPALGLPSGGGVPDLPIADDLRAAATSMANWRNRLWCTLRSRAQLFLEQQGRSGWGSTLAAAYTGVTFLDVPDEDDHPVHGTSRDERGPLTTLVLDEGEAYTRDEPISALELEEFPTDRAEVTFERCNETIDA